MLLEGESHFVDATAIVMFLICKDAALENHFDPVQAFLKFLRLAVGGPIFGFFCGLIISWFLSKFRGDNTFIVMMTFMATFLVFFVGEEKLHVSGTLAIIVMGL